MTSHQISALINAVIPVFGGIYFTLLVYRIIGKKAGQDAQYDEWHAKYGRVLKVLAPLIIVFGIAYAIVDFVR